MPDRDTEDSRGVIHEFGAPTVIPSRSEESPDRLRDSSLRLGMTDRSHPATSSKRAPWHRVALRHVLVPISRREVVQPDVIYRILGAHWYAGGLYVKDVKPGSEIQADTLYRVERGDFVYNRLFAWKGSFAIADNENHGCYVSGEFPCFRVNNAVADPGFLRWYFSRSTVWEEALALSAGGTPTSRNRLREEKLLSMTVPLPPLEEQRRIVARIEDLAERTEEVRKLQLECAEAAQALVVSLHLSVAGSRVIELSDILVLDEDRVEITDGQDYPQVGVRGFGQGLFTRDPVTSTETTYSWFNRLYDGALVLSQVKGWEGAVAVCDAKYAGRYVSPEYRTFRCRPAMALPGYLEQVVATPWFWERLRFATRGVGGRRERNEAGAVSEAITSDANRSGPAQGDSGIRKAAPGSTQATGSGRRVGRVTASHSRPGVSRGAVTDDA